MKIEINTAQQINIYVLQSYEAKKKKESQSHPRSDDFADKTLAGTCRSGAKLPRQKFSRLSYSNS